MKKMYKVLLLLAVGVPLLGAAEDNRVRGFKFCQQVQDMYKPVIVASCDRAEKILRDKGLIGEGESATGTMATIYYDLKRLGYQGYYDAHQDTAQQAWQIIDQFKLNDENVYTDTAAWAFNEACKDPQDVDGWLYELSVFSFALVQLAESMPGAEKFKCNIFVAERIANNHGIFGTQEEHDAIAAFQMAVPIAFHRRFVAMKDEKTIQTFMQGVPQVFANLQLDLATLESMQNLKKKQNRDTITVD